MIEIKKVFDNSMKKDGIIPICNYQKKSISIKLHTNFIFMKELDFIILEAEQKESVRSARFWLLNHLLLAIIDYHEDVGPGKNQLICKCCGNRKFTVFDDRLKCVKCKSEVDVQIAPSDHSLYIYGMNESPKPKGCYALVGPGMAR